MVLKIGLIVKEMIEREYIYRLKEEEQYHAKLN